MGGQLGPPQPRGEDVEEEAEEPCGRPDRPGQEESSDRLDGEAACRGPGPPSGQPRCQRSALEDQHPAPDGERQPTAAEQRAASQTFPPLHTPSLPPQLPLCPPPLPAAQAPHCPPCSRLLRQQFSLVYLSSRNRARARCNGRRARTPGCRRKTRLPGAELRP